MPQSIKQFPFAKLFVQLCFSSWFLFKHHTDSENMVFLPE